MESFISRNNKVFRTDEGGVSVIIKRFSSEDAAANEQQALLLLKSRGLLVPTVIGRRGNELIMEDLGDGLVLHMFIQAEERGDDPYVLCEPLFMWFRRFFDAGMGAIVRLDPNFRNFIIRGNTLYGIDFEQRGGCEAGAVLGIAAAFAVTYDTAFTPYKRRFAEMLLDMGRVFAEPGEIRRFANAELAAMEQRRGVSINFRF